MSSDAGSVSAGTEANQPGGRTPKGSAIMASVGRHMSTTTTIYMAATTFVLPIGVVSAIITIHYLTPAQFGELGLLMVLASFITVIYNMGLLHGTFLWVYGSSGDTGDDVLETTGQTDIAGQRRALTTGLVLSLAIAVAGTAIFFTLAKPISTLILGAPTAANLIALAAISGAAGSIYRLTTNVYRFERRPYAYAAATIARPIGVLVGSTGLIVAGFGVRGALIGTALPTFACALGNIVFTRRNYAWSCSWYDLKQIGIRTSWVVLPLIGLNVTHSGDLYLLAHWVHGSQLGVYRLASRLASPPSYFASAVLMAWTPLERSPTFLAAFQARGPQKVRAFMLTYYIIAGLTIVVIFCLFSHVFLLVAPKTYAEAAKIVPLGSLAFVVYGLYIVVLRTVRPDPLIFWYTVTALLAAAVFIGSGFLLVPAFGVYGAPAAVTVGMMTGCVALLAVSRRSAKRRGTDPLPVQYRRIAAALVVAGTVSAAGILGSNAGRATEIPVALVGLIIYFPALVLTGAIPVPHLAVFKSMLPSRGERRPTLTVEDLPPAERDVLERFQTEGLANARPADYARAARGLRRLAGFGATPSQDDVRLGQYLVSPNPESIRDWELRALIEDGADGYELSHLERLAQDARRGRLDRKRRSFGKRGSMRARIRTLEPHELTELHDAVSSAATRVREKAPPGPGVHDPLAQVRALRALRRLLGIGEASAADFALARALWSSDDGVAADHRDELRLLRAASRLALQSPDPTAAPSSLAEPVPGDDQGGLVTPAPEPLPVAPEAVLSSVSKRNRNPLTQRPDEAVLARN